MADIQIEQGLGVGKLQVCGPAPEAAFRRFAGFDAPGAGRQVHVQGVSFAWLSPREWLLTGDEAEVQATLARIDGQGGDEVLALDLSHARLSFVVTGADARDVLASLCPLDLWAEAFPVDAVARSLLGDTGMFVARLPDAADVPRFRIVVDQTMDGYAARLLAGPQARPGTPA